MSKLRRCPHPRTLRTIIASGCFASVPIAQAALRSPSRHKPTRAAGTGATSGAATANKAHLGRAGRLGAREFIEAVETCLLPALRRPSILILDNGPCHRSRLVKASRAKWRARGLRLFFLPPYCLHLNRIETLWRLVKHHWLPTDAYANFATLRDTVTDHLNTVGLNYRVTFS